MKLVDVHCHIYHESLKEQIDEVIHRAQQAGVKAIVLSGVNPASNRVVIELAKKYPMIKASLGIYPIDALGLAPDETGLPRHAGEIDIENEFDFFEKNIDNIVAIGEVGLDYKFGAEYKEKQKKNFARIIELTRKINKPIVVHTRKAEEDCVAMLENSGIKHRILHSFEGRKHLIKRAAELGFYFSIPATIVRSQHFQMMVEMVPLTQIFTETDSPWLSPFKEKPNEPAFVIETIKKIAEIKKMNEEEVADIIWKNYEKVFILK